VSLLILIPRLPILPAPLVFDLDSRAPHYTDEYFLDTGIDVACGPRPRWPLCIPGYQGWTYTGEEWPFRIYRNLCKRWRDERGYAPPFDGFCIWAAKRARPFVQNAWLNCGKPGHRASVRGGMAQDLVCHHRLIGSSYDRVRSLLGPPTRTTTRPKWLTADTEIPMRKGPRVPPHRVDRYGLGECCGETDDEMVVRYDGTGRVIVTWVED
jgi:hypothetical protein